MTGAAAAPCPLCGAARFIPVWAFRGLRHGCCGACGHVYAHLPPGEEPDYGNFGQAWPEAWLRDPANPMFALADHRVAHIGPGRGRALELGCGYGHFLLRLREAGWQVEGREASQPSAAFAREQFALPVATVPGGEAEPQLPEGPFDLIAAFHLLEHLADPRGLLKRARAALAPGGRLALAVPDLTTLPHDFTELWFIARGWHRHTFLPARLLGLLAEEGFEVIEAGPEPASRMSPSSFLVVARAGPRSAALPSPEAWALITAWHQTMETHRRRLRAAFGAWAAAGRRVGLFGAGIHTEALLALCEPGPGQVSCLIDDDPAKHGRQLGGVPVVGGSDPLARACEVIVVSTLATEAALVSRLRAGRPTTEIYGVYSDLLRAGVS